MRHPFAVICGLFFAAAILAVAGPVMSVADVERVTGLKGIHVVAPGAQAGAGPGLNFADGNNKLVLMVNTGPAALYDRARTQKDMDVGGKKYPMELFHASVPGVGDEAFDSPPGPLQYVIYLKKGANGATVSTYLSGGTPRLRMDQLKALAKIVADRL